MGSCQCIPSPPRSVGGDEKPKHLRKNNRKKIEKEKRKVTGNSSISTVSSSCITTKLQYQTKQPKNKKQKNRKEKRKKGESAEKAGKRQATNRNFFVAWCELWENNCFFVCKLILLFLFNHIKKVRRFRPVLNVAKGHEGRKRKESSRGKRREKKTKISFFLNERNEIKKVYFIFRAIFSKPTPTQDKITPSSSSSTLNSTPK